MAVVAVIVLIAVLFLSGTVMALAVSSSLHTVDIISAQDAVHYAAESAVARGVAAIEQEQAACLPGPPVNRQVLEVWCQNGLATSVHAADVQHRAIAGRQLAPGACLTIAIPSDSTAWTVLAWRGKGDVEVWRDNRDGAQPCLPSSTPCPPQLIFANVKYVTCEPDESEPFLHIRGRGAPIELGSSVIRAGHQGNDSVVTVVGMAGIEVDEADVVLPNNLAIWNTVRP
jgi:hypothetical protein